MDLTYPKVDAEEGWQYARSFDDPDEEWSAEPPPALERLLSGAGVMTAGFGASTSRQSSALRSINAQSWVRRRRWVRVMRRRLDIPPLPYLGSEGSMYQLAEDGTLEPYVTDTRDDDYGSDGYELGAMPRTFLSVSQDYVARSRYLAGTPADTSVNGDPTSAIEMRRAITKLEQAVMELRTGIFGWISFHFQYYLLLTWNAVH